MKTLLISFQNKYDNADLCSERKTLKLLSENSVFPDEICIIDQSDKEKFLEKLTSPFDAIFLGGKADFSILDELSERKIVPCDGTTNGKNDETSDETGEAGEDDKKFVALIHDNISNEEIDAIMLSMQKYFGRYHSKVVFKLFGLQKREIENVTNQISAKYPSAIFVTNTENLDSKTVLLFDNSAPKIEVDKAIKEFLITLKNNIYAEDDVSPEQRLNELLRLRRMKISCAESMTGGRIASKIVSIAGASDVFYEGAVTYNTHAKEERLNVSPKTVQSYGVVSNEVAFEMAKGLLDTGKVDAAISITGYAGATRDDSGKPEGLFFIGIGLGGDIEVYKYELSGTRTEIIEQATNAALFLMIKTITNA